MKREMLQDFLFLIILCIFSEKSRCLEVFDLKKIPQNQKKIQTDHISGKVELA